MSKLNNFLNKITNNKVFKEDSLYKDDIQKTSVKLKHNITFVGDSTDGEIQEQKEKGFINDKSSYLENFSDNVNTVDSQYQASFILKEIGNRLLQTSVVREKYKQIKDPLRENNPFLSLERDKMHKNSKIKIDLGERLKTKNEISELEKSISDGKLKMQKTIDKKNTEINKGKGRIDSNKDQIQRIVKFNEKIKFYFEEHRKEIEIFNSNDSEQSDASVVLSRIKTQKKFDRDTAKIEIYNRIYGTQKSISNKDICGHTTQKDLTLEISKGGAFTHKHVNQGSYETLGKCLKKYLVEGKLKKENLSSFFKSALKCKIASKDFILDKENKNALANEMKDVFKLLALEIQRNPASLLTIPMFFELFDKKYNGYDDISNMHNNLPMAMDGAVSGSVYIDYLLEQKFTSLSKYDYRDSGDKTKAGILAAKDQKILTDWIKLNGFDFKSLGGDIDHIMIDLYFLISEWYNIKMPYMLGILDVFDLDIGEIECLSKHEVKVLMLLIQDDDYVFVINKLLESKHIADILERFEDYKEFISNIQNITDYKDSFDQLYELHQNNSLERVINIYNQINKETTRYFSIQSVIDTFNSELQDPNDESSFDHYISDEDIDNFVTNKLLKDFRNDFKEYYSDRSTDSCSDEELRDKYINQSFSGDDDLQYSSAE